MRWVRRLRRHLLDLRAPSSTVLAFAHHIADNGARNFGLREFALDRQRPGAVEAAADLVLGDNVQFHIGPRGRVRIGARATIGPNVVIAADDLVQVGDRSRIGAGAAITDTWTYGGEYGPRPEPVMIADDVVVGPNAVIGPGSRISQTVRVPPGAIVGPGAVEAG